MNLEELPEELAIKIYAEYAPAPDPDRVFFRITIMQQVDMNIWVYMVTMDGAVIPTHSRTYPRELERALRNCAKSLEAKIFIFLCVYSKYYDEHRDRGNPTKRRRTHRPDDIVDR